MPKKGRLRNKSLSESYEEVTEFQKMKPLERIVDDKYYVDMVSCCTLGAEPGEV